MHLFYSENFYQHKMIGGGFYLPSELNTAPWVDGSLGRPLSPPTAQCAPPHFGLLPSLFPASPSQICLFFVAFMDAYQEKTGLQDLCCPYRRIVSTR